MWPEPAGQPLSAPGRSGAAGQVTGRSSLPLGVPSGLGEYSEPSTPFGANWPYLLSWARWAAVVFRGFISTRACKPSPSPSPGDSAPALAEDGLTHLRPSEQVPDKYLLNSRWLSVPPPPPLCSHACTCIVTRVHALTHLCVHACKHTHTCTLTHAHSHIGHTQVRSAGSDLYLPAQLLRGAQLTPLKPGLASQVLRHLRNKLPEFFFLKSGAYPRESLGSVASLKESEDMGDLMSGPRPAPSLEWAVRGHHWTAAWSHLGTPRLGRTYSPCNSTSCIASLNQSQEGQTLN